MIEAAKTQKRNTVQKQTVEKIVLSSCDHPSAETIFNRARDLMASISLGTVYRILKELAADGVIREVYVPGEPSRFDKTNCVHAHFLCEVCGEVTDVELDSSALIDDVRLLNLKNKVNEAEIIFKGICGKCSEGK